MGVRFGARLQSKRMERGLSQAELGKDLCTASYISMLESGVREPTAVILAELANRLRITPQDLEPRDDAPSHDADFVLAELSAREAWDARDYAQAATHAAMAAQLALMGAHHSDWWNMTYLQAECALKHGELAECQRLAQQLVEHRMATESPGLAARAQQLLAASCHGLGQLDAAVDYARRAAELAARVSHSTTTHISALNVLVSTLADRGHLDEAWAQCSALAALVDDTSTGQLAGQVEWTIGNVAFMRDDWEEGVQRHERAAALLSPAHDLALWAQFNKATAAARLAAGRVEPATLAALERAEVSLEIVGSSRRGHLEVALIRAQWLYLSGDATAAAERLAALYPEACEIGPYQAGEVALLHGRALAALGSAEDALDMLESARRHFVQAGSWHRVKECIDAGTEARRHTSR
jgi:transcriptional regulator with XRE-family HTH domain